jgi:hypothetical protein
VVFHRFLSARGGKREDLGGRVGLDMQGAKWSQYVNSRKRGAGLPLNSPDGGLGRYLGSLCGLCRGEGCVLGSSWMEASGSRHTYSQGQVRYSTRYY